VTPAKRRAIASGRLAHKPHLEIAREAGLSKITVDHQVRDPPVRGLTHSAFSAAAILSKPVPEARRARKRSITARWPSNTRRANGPHSARFWPAGGHVRCGSFGEPDHRSLVIFSFRPRLHTHPAKDYTPPAVGILKLSARSAMAARNALTMKANMSQAEVYAIAKDIPIAKSSPEKLALVMERYGTEVPSQPAGR